SRRESLNETVGGLQHALNLLQQEIRMTEPYVAKGAASAVEVLRLRRQASDLQNKIDDARNQYYVKAREELSKTTGDIESLRSVVRGRQDALTRLVFFSPVNGIVKDIDVTTAGGVVPPNGNVMTIVPVEDQLLRSEEHTSELQSRENLVCRLLLEKKKNFKTKRYIVRE